MFEKLQNLRTFEKQIVAGLMIIIILSRALRRVRLLARLVGFATANDISGLEKNGKNKWISIRLTYPQNSIFNGIFIQ